MSQLFTLEVTRVECRNEQRLEWGKDEIRPFAFAVARTGGFFAIGYRSLGSYGTGDVRSNGIFPMKLVDAELADDSLEVPFYVWHRRRGRRWRARFRGRTAEQDEAALPGSGGTARTGRRPAHMHPAHCILQGRPADAPSNRRCGHTKAQ